MKRTGRATADGCPPNLFALLPGQSLGTIAVIVAVGGISPTIGMTVLSLRGHPRRRQLTSLITIPVIGLFHILQLQPAGQQLGPAVVPVLRPHPVRRRRITRPHRPVGPPGPRPGLRILVACGAGGGVAATFNAPVTGVFFGVEITLREFSIDQPRLRGGPRRPAPAT